MTAVLAFSAFVSRVEAALERPLTSRDRSALLIAELRADGLELVRLAAWWAQVFRFDGPRAIVEADDTELHGLTLGQLYDEYVGTVVSALTAEGEGSLL